jgi:hypothetical protein
VPTESAQKVKQKMANVDIIVVDKRYMHDSNTLIHLVPFIIRVSKELDEGFSSKSKIAQLFKVEGAY